MMRLLSIGIDCVSAAIFVIPALAILQCKSTGNGNLNHFV